MNKLELHESILNNSQITLARLENRIVQALVVQKKKIICKGDKTIIFSSKKTRTMVKLFYGFFIKVKMVKDDKLKTSALSNGEQMFSNNIMPRSFDDTLQKSYFKNMEAYESWLKDKEKYEFMRKMMAEALYKAFLKD